MEMRIQQQIIDKLTIQEYGENPECVYMRVSGTSFQVC